MTRLATRIQRIHRVKPKSNNNSSNSNKYKYPVDGNRFFTETPRDNTIENHVHGKLRVTRDKTGKVQKLSLISEGANK